MQNDSFDGHARNKKERQVWRASLLKESKCWDSWTISVHNVQYWLQPAWTTDPSESKWQEAPYWSQCDFQWPQNCSSLECKSTPTVPLSTMQYHELDFVAIGCLVKQLNPGKTGAFALSIRVRKADMGRDRDADKGCSFRCGGFRPQAWGQWCPHFRGSGRASPGRQLAGHIFLVKRPSCFLCRCWRERHWLWEALQSIAVSQFLRNFLGPTLHQQWILGSFGVIFHEYCGSSPFDTFDLELFLKF